jgi:hypothetical protein
MYPITDSGARATDGAKHKKRTTFAEDTCHAKKLIISVREICSRKEQGA